MKKKESEAYVYAINRARKVEVGPEVGKDFTQCIVAVISKQLKIRKNLIKLRIDYFKSRAY